MSVKFLFMNHWGVLYLLPSLEVSITYSMPTISLRWLVFRVDLEICRCLPNWFMKYVWGFLNFDFLVKKEDDE